MAASTGPIVAATSVVVLNAILIQEKAPITQSRTIVGGAIAAAGLALLEKGLPGVAVMLSWTVLVAVLFVRVDPSVPSPLESLNRWYQGG